MRDPAPAQLTLDEVVKVHIHTLLVLVTGNDGPRRVVEAAARLEADLRVVGVVEGWGWVWGCVGVAGA